MAGAEGAPDAAEFLSVSTDRTETEVDPSVCYRHPDRHSWTLCARCGRTICPECQLPSPSGAQCAVCVADAGGAVQWLPANAPARPPAQRATRRIRVSGLLGAETGTPVVSRLVLGGAVLLWLAGFFTGNLPFALLAALPGFGWQVWRFLTAVLAYPAEPSVVGVLGFALTVLFFALTGPQAERQLGRLRFLEILLVTSVVSSAASLLAGQPAYGLIGPLFGVFGAVLVLVWPDSRTRTRFLVMIGINLLLILVLSQGQGLACIVGALLAGAGVTALRRRAADRPLPRPWTPDLIVAGGTVVLVLLAALAAS